MCHSAGVTNLIQGAVFVGVAGLTKGFLESGKGGVFGRRLVMSWPSRTLPNILGFIVVPGDGSGARIYDAGK
jgi:hypothetical protein